MQPFEGLILTRPPPKTGVCQASLLRAGEREVRSALSQSFKSSLGQLQKVNQSRTDLDQLQFGLSQLQKQSALASQELAIFQSKEAVLTAAIAGATELEPILAELTAVRTEIEACRAKLSATAEQIAQAETMIVEKETMIATRPAIKAECNARYAALKKYTEGLTGLSVNPMEYHSMRDFLEAGADVTEDSESTEFFDPQEFSQVDDSSSAEEEDESDAEEPPKPI